MFNLPRSPGVPPRVLAVLAGVLAVLAGAGAAEAQVAAAYTVTDLGSLGGNVSVATAVNATGQVAGYSTLPGDSVTHAFRYADGRMTDLVGLGGNNHAGGINAAGQVTGDSDTGAGKTRPFLFTPDGGLTDLGANSVLLSVTNPPGLRVSGLNDRGQIIASIPGQSGRGLVFSPGNAPVYLGYLPNSPSATNATGINNAGQITGSGYDAFDSVHAMRFEDGGRRAVDLGTLPGGTASFGTAINDHGVVVGGADTGGGVTHAFRHDPGVGMSDLGTMGGYQSCALGVNAAATVVGGLYPGDPESTSAARAFIHSADRGMVDLNTLLVPESGWTLRLATAINDAGQIVGYGLNHDRVLHAFLLTPAGTSTVSVQGDASAGGFIVSRPADAVGASVAVAYHNGGSAVQGVDYEAFPGRILLGAGQGQGVIPIRLLPGANRNRKVKVFLDPDPAGTAYRVGKAQSKVFLSDLH